MIPESINRFFKEGRIHTIPRKSEPRKLMLEYLDSQLEKGGYTELEINQWLLQYYDDYAILRRFLVDYGYINRTKDGSLYTK